MIECNLSENWLIDRVDLTMKAIISLAIYELMSYEKYLYKSSLMNMYQ